MTRLHLMPIAQPLPAFASATTSDPLKLAVELWAPEVQADKELLLEKLHESIETYVYPTGREELLDYIADNRSSFRQYWSHEEFNREVIPQKVSWNHIVAVSLISMVSMGIVDNTDVTALQGLLGVGIFAGLTYIPYTIRTTAKAIFDRRFDDLQLIKVASAIASVQGDRLLENHFNALWAQEVFDRRFQIPQNEIDSYIRDLLSRGSIHGYHYGKLLVPPQRYIRPEGTTYVYNFEVMMDFDDRAITSEMNGDEKTQDINLISSVHSRRFYSNYGSYLKTSDEGTPESFRLATTIIGRLKQRDEATSHPKVRVAEGEESTTVHEEDAAVETEKDKNRVR